MMVAVAIGTLVLGYLMCSLMAHKLVNDYWHWRFREPYDTNWAVYLGPASLLGAVCFRLTNRSKERFPPL